MSKEVIAVTTAAPEPDWAAFVALDWADQKHYWKLAEAGSQKREQGELDNTPEAVAGWAADLNVRFGGRPIAVCLEQSRGSLVYMLLKYPQLVLFPVNPKMGARFREAFHPSGSKGDPSDTDVLLDILVHHGDRLRRLKPDTAETRLLQRLVEQRRLMVNEKTRQSNRLTACLKLYFPQALKWFDDVTSPLVGALLEQWPDLEKTAARPRRHATQVLSAAQLPLGGAHPGAHRRHSPGCAGHYRRGRAGGRGDGCSLLDPADRGSARQYRRTG